MAPRIYSYAYSEGPAAIASPATAAPATAAYQAQNTLAVIEQAAPSTTVYARLAAPALFTDALAAWATSLSLTAPAGGAGDYAVTYNPATKRVTIASTTATPFRPVFPGVVGAWLGFVAALSGWATSWTGDAAPLGVLELLGGNVQPAEDAARLDLEPLRLNRQRLTLWGNVQRQRVQLTVGKASAAGLAGPCLAGRVRLYQGSGGAYDSAWSATNPTGYVDGYVLEVGKVTPLGSREDWLRVDLTMAVQR